MDWPNERWVKQYTRETPEWCSWPWQSRALLPHLIMRCDKAGQIGLGRSGVAGLADLVRLPIDLVQPGIDGLLDDGCVTQSGQVLTIENFVEAQEAKTSDKLRQQNLRDRRKSLKDNGSNVTQRHAASRSDESRVEERRGEEKDQKQLHLSAPPPAAAPSIFTQVFSYWSEKLNHPRAILDDKRMKLLKARVAEGMTLEEGKSVVDGCAVDIQTWPDRARFDGIEYLFADRAAVEKFMGMAGKAFRPPKGDYKRIAVQDTSTWTDEERKRGSRVVKI
jgi:hypothetical protein